MKSLNEDEKFEWSEKRGFLSGTLYSLASQIFINFVITLKT